MRDLVFNLVAVWLLLVFVTLMLPSNPGTSDGLEGLHVQYRAVVVDD